MRRTLTILGGLLLLSGTALAQVEISFDEEGANASGVTAGGDVVFFGVSRDRGEWFDHFYHWRRIIKDDDLDGTVTFVREEPFPLLSALVVVDLTLGEYAIATAYPHETAIPPLDLGGAQTAPDGRLTAFAQVGKRIDVLVSRAGTGAGAWGASVIDGGPLDQDTIADGTVTIAFAALPPLGGKTAPLDGVRPGDVVALADAAGPWARVTKVAGEGAGE